MGGLRSLWFGFQASVGRKAYVLSGLGLMALKYAVDNAVTWLYAGAFLDPIAYLNPVLDARIHDVSDADAMLFVWMGLWALPFIWIGVSMSVRRAMDAGWSRWTGLLFLCPGLNYLMIAALCVAPSIRVSREGGEAVASDTTAPSPESGSVIPSAIVAVVLSMAVSLGLTVLSVFVLGDYGSALFVATPFVMGVLAAVVVHRHGYRGRKVTFAVAGVSLLIGEGALLLFALEGAICIMMVTPLAALLVLLGAWIGDLMVQGPRRPTGSATAMVVVLPVLALIPAISPVPQAVAPVVTSMEIDAPPEAVWPHVVGFAPLDPPEHWLFKAGVAAPMRARIEGEGVGAVRHCEFTTGAFVEPITAWDPPHHLAFDVTSQPPSMREMGLWPVVHAPHVEGTMSSQRGEFRLVALPGGRTRLTGTTWYTLDLAPEPYWRLWSDAVVHLIHERVLEHIAGLAERPG